jgi:hypothetical protein
MKYLARAPEKTRPSKLPEQQILRTSRRGSPPPLVRRTALSADKCARRQDFLRLMVHPGGSLQEEARKLEHTCALSAGKEADREMFDKRGVWCRRDGGGGRSRAFILISHPCSRASTTANRLSLRLRLHPRCAPESMQGRRKELSTPAKSAEDASSLAILIMLVSSKSIS